MNSKIYVDYFLREKFMRTHFVLFALSILVLLLACAPTTPDMSGATAALTVANNVKAENLLPWVEQLAVAHSNDVTVDCAGFKAEDLFPACHLSRDAAVALVSDALTTMGFAPDTVVLGQGPQAAFNVVAEWPGTTRAKEVVLVGAHLDAFYAGADDNSSAVAALLETARAVRNYSFARTIRFVAFDLEEFGAIGSTRYVQAGYADDVTAAIVLDLIGYASSAPGSQDDVMGLKLPDVGDFLLVVGNKDSAEKTQQVMALGGENNLAKLVGIIAPGDGGYFLSSMFMRSDHGLLWRRGIPTVFFTDTANFRNPHYHKPSDTPETLDANFLARNTRLTAAAVALFAEVQL